MLFKDNLQMLENEPVFLREPMTKDEALFIAVNNKPYDDYAKDVAVWSSPFRLDEISEF